RDRQLLREKRICCLNRRCTILLGFHGSANGTSHRGSCCRRRGTGSTVPRFAGLRGSTTPAIGAEVDHGPIPPALAAPFTPSVARSRAVAPRPVVGWRASADLAHRQAQRFKVAPMPSATPPSAPSAETAAREPGQDFIRDIVREDLQSGKH